MRTIDEIKADIENMHRLSDFEISKGRTLPYGDILKLKDLYDDFRRVITDSVPFDRLQEICEAEKDGRCVVLPCKKGDTVWAKTRYFSKSLTETKVIFVWYNGLEYKIVCDGIGHLTFGKNVFLTREEAEKALKGDLK